MSSAHRKRPSSDSPVGGARLQRLVHPQGCELRLGEHDGARLVVEVARALQSRGEDLEAGREHQRQQHEGHDHFDQRDNRGSARASSVADRDAAGEPVHVHQVLRSPEATVMRPPVELPSG
jgi:hypothetical protein